MKKKVKKVGTIILAGAMVAGMATTGMAGSDSCTMALDRGRAECYLECDATSASASTDVYANYKADVVWAFVDVQFEALTSSGVYEYIDYGRDYNIDHITISESAYAAASGDIGYCIEKNASSGHTAGIDNDNNMCALSVDY